MQNINLCDMDGNLFTSSFALFKLLSIWVQYMYPSIHDSHFICSYFVDHIANSILCLECILLQC